MEHMKLTTRRLPQPRRRLQRRTTPSRQHRSSTNSRSRRRLYDNIIPVIVAALRARGIRRYAGSLATRTSRSRLQQRYRGDAGTAGGSPRARQVHQRNAASTQSFVPAWSHSTEGLDSTGRIQGQKGHCHHCCSASHTHEPQDLVCTAVAYMML